MPDLRALAIFVKVAERRSFVRAAEELGITQSGVSNAINRLDDQLGVRLLARTTRRVGLTEDGAAFFERCRQVLAELEEAELVLREARLKPIGRLRVDLPVSFGRLKVVPLLGAFRARHPELKLAISLTDRYVDLIEEGVDVCVRFGVLQDSSLIARRLTGTQFRVVGTPSYFSERGRSKTPDDLVRHDCLAFTRHDARLARDWRFARGGAETSVTPKGRRASVTVQRCALRPWRVTASRRSMTIISTRRSPPAGWKRCWRNSDPRLIRSGWSTRKPVTCRRGCAPSSTS